MSSSQDIAILNNLLEDIKILAGSVSVLDRAIESKDSTSTATALDAINFRVREIAKAVQNASGTNNLNFSVDELLAELKGAKPNPKTIHEHLDNQIESLRKLVLSQILTLSID